MGFPNYKVSKYLYDNLSEVLRENGLPVTEIPVMPTIENAGQSANTLDDRAQIPCDILTIIDGQEVIISRDANEEKDDFRLYAFLARNDKFLPKKLRLHLFEILEKHGAIMQI